MAAIGLGVVCVRVSLFTSQIVITLYMSVCVCTGVI